jgi:hypothetical protein
MSVAPLPTPVDRVLPGVCPDTLQDPATDQGVPLPAAAAARTGVSAAQGRGAWTVAKAYEFQAVVV